MKKIFAFTFLFFAVAANAQDFIKDTSQQISIDSSKIIVPITLKSEYHYLIIDCLDGVSRSEWAGYAGQVAKAMDTVYNPSKLITVNLESGSVAELFFLMSAQQERIAAILNKDFRNNVLLQLESYPWLYRQLQNIQGQNAALMQQRKQRAFNLLKQLR